MKTIRYIGVYGYVWACLILLPFLSCVQLGYEKDGLLDEHKVFEASDIDANIPNDSQKRESLLEEDSPLDRKSGREAVSIKSLSILKRNYHRLPIYKIKDSLVSLDSRGCPPYQMMAVNDSKIFPVERATYQYDATYIAMMILYRENFSKYKDIVRIPACLYLSVYYGLIHVYNSSSASRDLVVNKHKIHTWHGFSLRKMTVTGKCDLKLMKANRHSSIIGEPWIDGFFSKYGLQIIEVTRKEGYCKAIIAVPPSINTRNLSKEFNSKTKDYYSFYEGRLGDGNDIEAEFHRNGIIIDYSLGRGDCPLGCTKSYHFRFQVTPIGRVLFLGTRQFNW